MKIHKAKVLVLEDGKVVIDGVPVNEGHEVEVTIHILAALPPTFPLKGLKILKYDDPFGPAVDPSEWNALK